jgi:DNA-binding CsgD family transcriptional regulator
MAALSHTQWSLLNRFTLELHSANTREHFFHCCLEELPTLLDLAWTCWNEMDADYQFVDFKTSKTFADVLPEFTEAIDHTMHTHPTAVGGGFLDRTEPHPGVFMMSDFVSERQKKNNAIYREAYRHLETHYQMYAELDFTKDVRSGISLNSYIPISEEKRYMTTLIMEHLEMAYRNVITSEQPGPEFDITNPLQEQPASLSPRLQETLGHLLHGLPRKWIAEKMGISIHTLNDYVRELYSRLDVHSHAELIARFRNG